MKRGEFYTSDFYMIGLKNIKSTDITFGRTKYDHQSGAMFFMKPNQAVSNIDNEVDNEGFIIYFHGDFLNGQPLHADIKNYGYFDYGISEALHLSPKENQIIWSLYQQIVTESDYSTDEYSRNIILTQVSTILQYVQRFYTRQFIDRHEIIGQTSRKFNQLLHSYFEGGDLSQSGLPTVRAMAEKLNLTPRYLSDLLKAETGKTTMELIHLFLMTEAKNLLKGGYSVKEIAHKLGFENRPYFSRMFKREIGISANEFKKQHLN